MNDTSWLQAVVRNRRPMSPQPTDVRPQLRSMPEISAVIFDIYGTLLISGSGDVGSANQEDRGALIGEAFAALGIQENIDSLPTIDDLRAQIQSSHDSRKSVSCPKPEVDIVDIWRRTLRQLGMRKFAADTKLVARLAAEYESRANPTWPMPGAVDLLARLRAQKIAMGIVSNAQVFTVNLVEDLLGSSLAGGGFDLELCIFSNRFRHAKPGPRLFDVLNGGLAQRGIQPAQAVYVGNDMLNDVWAASGAGLKTAWFVGDARSCRPRDDDPRCRSLRPDVVISNLMQLPDCLEIG